MAGSSKMWGGFLSSRRSKELQLIPSSGTISYAPTAQNKFARHLLRINGAPYALDTSWLQGLIVDTPSSVLLREPSPRTTFCIYPPAQARKFTLFLSGFFRHWLRYPVKNVFLEPQSLPSIIAIIRAFESLARRVLWLTRNLSISRIVSVFALCFKAL